MASQWDMFGPTQGPLFTVPESLQKFQNLQKGEQEMQLRNQQMLMNQEKMKDNDILRQMNQLKLQTALQEQQEQQRIGELAKTLDKNLSAQDRMQQLGMKMFDDGLPGLGTEYLMQANKLQASQAKAQLTTEQALDVKYKGQIDSLKAIYERMKMVDGPEQFAQMNADWKSATGQESPLAHMPWSPLMKHTLDLMAKRVLTEKDQAELALKASRVAAQNKASAASAANSYAHAAKTLDEKANPLKYMRPMSEKTGTPKPYTADDFKAAQTLIINTPELKGLQDKADAKGIKRVNPQVQAQREEIARDVALAAQVRAMKNHTTVKQEIGTAWANDIKPNLSPNMVTHKKEWYEVWKDGDTTSQEGWKYHSPQLASTPSGSQGTPPQTSEGGSLYKVQSNGKMITISDKEFRQYDKKTQDYIKSHWGNS